MLGFSSDLENPRQVTDAPVSTRPRTGMPSRVNWAVMGGPTAQPTGVTLALDDPPRSLNAPGGSPGCLLAREAREHGLWVGHERFPGLVAATSAAAGSERGSDRRNDPPHRIGSSVEASCLAGGMVAENRGLLPHNRDTTGGQVGKEAAVW